MHSLTVGINNTVISSNSTCTATNVGRHQLKITSVGGLVTYDTVVVSSEATTFTDSLTVCNSLTWIDGKTYTSNNTTATHTIMNAVGCDSVVTLNLTIDSVSDITTTSTAGNVITANNINATYQ